MLTKGMLSEAELEQVSGGNIFDDIGDFFEDTANTIADAAEDVADATVDALKKVYNVVNPI